MSLESSIEKRKLLLWLFCGALVCVFSLNGVLRFVASQWWPDTRTGAVLVSVASIPDFLYGKLPGGPFLLFELLLRWVVILLAAHLVLLLIASIRHHSRVIFVSGMSGFFIGLFSLTWLSFLLLILVFLIRLFSLIMWLLRVVLSAIGSFLLWAPVFYMLVAVGGIVIVVAIIAAFKEISFRAVWESLKEWLRNLSARPLVFLLALLLVGALIWFVGIPLWEHYISPILLAIRNWLAEYVAPILTWIASLLLMLIAGTIVAVLILLFLAVLGCQLADQFKASRICGSDTHKTFSAGFGTGAALGLVLLVCAANPDFRSLVITSWSETSPVLSSMDLSAAVYYFMPARIENTLHAALAKASLPVFDLLVLLLTLLLANSSLITGMLSRVTIRPLRALIAWRSLPPVALALFAVIVVAAESYASDNA